ncbi:MAG: ABC transporter permease [Dehalococcoidia bacterium]
MTVSGLPAVELDRTLAPEVRPLPFRLLGGVVWFARRKPLGFFCAVVMTILVLLAIPWVEDVVAPYPYAEGVTHIRHGHRLQPGSSGDHLLGTDNHGRDTLSRLIYGTRVTILVGFGAVTISVLVSTVIGIVSGYYMGWVDKVGQRLVDVFQALPGLALLITIFGVYGRGWWQLVVVIGIVIGLPGSRILRGQVLSVMASPYVEGARVVGAGNFRIMLRYVLSNVMALVILAATFRLGQVVLLEATLSFLGFGIPPPYPSWGQMLSLEGREFMRTAPGLAIYPGLAIGIAVFSFNLFGDALRDVLDPRLRGSR